MSECRARCSSSEEFNGLDMMVTEDRPHFAEASASVRPGSANRDHGNAGYPPERGGALGAVGRYRHSTATAADGPGTHPGGMGAADPNAPASTHEAEVLLPGGRRRIEQWTKRASSTRTADWWGAGHRPRCHRAARRRAGAAGERGALSGVAEDLTEMICRCDRNFVITFANEAQAGVIGVPPRSWWAAISSRAYRSTWRHTCASGCWR